METEQHPLQQSPPVITSVHDEGLQPHAQSYDSCHNLIRKIMGTICSSLVLAEKTL